MIKYSYVTLLSLAEFLCVLAKDFLLFRHLRSSISSEAVSEVLPSKDHVVEQKICNFGTMAPKKNLQTLDEASISVSNNTTPGHLIARVIAYASGKMQPGCPIALKMNIRTWFSSR